MITIARDLEWSDRFVLLSLTNSGVELVSRLSGIDAERLHAELTRQLRGSDRLSKLERRCERLQRALKRKRVA